MIFDPKKKGILQIFAVRPCRQLTTKNAPRKAATSGNHPIITSHEGSRYFQLLITRFGTSQMRRNPSVRTMNVTHEGVSIQSQGRFTIIPTHPQAVPTTGKYCREKGW